MKFHWSIVPLAVFSLEDSTNVAANLGFPVNSLVPCNVANFIAAGPEGLVQFQTGRFPLLVSDFSQLPIDSPSAVSGDCDTLYHVGRSRGVQRSDRLGRRSWRTSGYVQRHRSRRLQAS